MHSVFVAGSRSISRLNSEVRERIDNIVRQNFTVLVGDANGADKAVQRHLTDVHYRNAIVYCMDVCRNNVGNWPVRSHVADPGVKHDRFYYGIKDSAMVKDATCGYMLWDGVSKGTLSNAVGLINANKKVLLYLSPKKQFFSLSNLDDLREAVTAAEIRDVGLFLNSVGITGETTGHLRFGAGRDRSHSEVR
jgi:hypothetical protein